MKMTNDIQPNNERQAGGSSKPRFREYLDDVISGLESVQKRQRSGYSIKPNDWFFPSDVYPHSARFKYRCSVLAKAGIIETDNSTGRWGKRYRVPENVR